jgi:hypothetical protein
VFRTVSAQSEVAGCIRIERRTVHLVGGDVLIAGGVTN